MLCHDVLKNDHIWNCGFRTVTFGCYQIRQCFHFDPASPCDKHCSLLLGVCLAKLLKSAFLEFVQWKTGITFPLSYISLYPLFLSVLVSVRRKSKQALRDYKKVQIQLENLETSVRDRCKKEFTGERV